MVALGVQPHIVVVTQYLGLGNFPKKTWYFWLKVIFCVPLRTKHIWDVDRPQHSFLQPLSVPE